MLKLNKRTFHRTALATAIGATLLSAGLPVAHAQQTFKLTIASSHPTTLPWVGLMSTLFVPEVNKRVEALGKGYKIEWKEAYGGQLYKMNATLSSVGEGIADIGWVFANLESAKMPLTQYATVTPFATGDVRMLLEVANEMNEKVPALKAEWDRNNLVFLGASGVDTYHLFTKMPINTYADLSGKKISAPGAVGTWLRGSGAVAVDGSLTSYYTDIQTGVSEGTISISTGILPNKIYEVAPYVTTVDIGALYNGGMAMNKDSFNKMPPEVQKIIKDVGLEYSKTLGNTLMQRYESALKSIQTQGATQSVPVKVAPMAAGEREKWATTMPNIAADWVKANASRGPSALIVKTYMEELRKRGAKPLRDWDKGL